MVALQLFVSRTRTGRAMRSTALDRDAALADGRQHQPHDRDHVLHRLGARGRRRRRSRASSTANIRFDIGFQAGLKAFTAAVLGGIGNIVGAALGGFVIGFIEVSAAVAGYNSWSAAIVFGTLVIVLVFRPQGILGQQTAERV